MNNFCHSAPGRRHAGPAQSRLDQGDQILGGHFLGFDSQQIHAVNQNVCRRRDLSTLVFADQRLQSAQSTRKCALSLPYDSSRIANQCGRVR